MIYVGIDDTDMPGTPGTNHFCRALVNRLSSDFHCRLIVRHQLLFDQRIPYTSKNSSASIQLMPHDQSEAKGSHRDLLDTLKGQIRAFIQERYLPGSDPGFCVTRHVPAEIAKFGQRCQQDVVKQAEARQLAKTHGIHLEGCGGTEDGVIGSLAAVGLASTGDDGRIVQIGAWPDDLSGHQPVEELRSRDVIVVSHQSNDSITDGTIDIGKRLRPSYRDDRIVLYATRDDLSSEIWHAVRLA